MLCVCREPHGPDTGVWVRHPSHRYPQPSHQPGDKEGKSVGFIFIYFSFPLNLTFCKARNGVVDPDSVGSGIRIRSDPDPVRSETFSARSELSASNLKLI